MDETADELWEATGIDFEAYGAEFTLREIGLQAAERIRDELPADRTVPALRRLATGLLDAADGIEARREGSLN
jgi:hypothetical protein